MSDLARALRRAREFKVTVGKFTFTARRPTDVEALELHRSNITFDQIAKRFVVDWAGVTEDDVKGGGGSTIAPPFDRDDWEEWCADRPDFWQPIANGILDQYAKHAKKAEDVGKN